MKTKNSGIKAKSSQNGVEKKKSPKIAKVGKKQHVKDTPAKVVPPKKVVEEEEDDSEEDVEEEVQATGKMVEEENSDDEDAEVDGDEEDGEDDDDDEEEEDDEDDEEAGSEEDAEPANEEEDKPEDDSDEEPTEAPIAKKAAPKTGKGGIPQIKTGPISRSMPDNQIIVIKNLPKKFKQIDIVEVFGKFGTITDIHNLYGPDSSTSFVAYTTAESATAAIAATNNKAQIKDKKVKVSIKKSNLSKQQINKDNELNKDRTLYIRNVSIGTTEEQITDHFKSHGEIECVRVVTKNEKVAFAFVTFKDEVSAENARKLHNTVLNGATIGVFSQSKEGNRSTIKDLKRTLILRNSQNLENISGEKLSKVFAKCGEIETLDILCKKNVLAFITFKTEADKKNALKLNGTKVGDLQLEIDEYKAPGGLNKTTIYIQHVKPGVTEEEIRELFSTTGEIANVFIKANFAIVKFQTSDAFCKSFLLNESILHGQMIFLEPYSDKKQLILKSQHKTYNSHKPHFGQKRKAYTNHVGGKPKKQKSN